MSVRALRLHNGNIAQSNARRAKLRQRKKRKKRIQLSNEDKCALETKRRKIKTQIWKRLSSGVEQSRIPVCVRICLNATDAHFTLSKFVMQITTFIKIEKLKKRQKQHIQNALHGEIRFGSASSNVTQNVLLQSERSTPIGENMRDHTYSISISGILLKDEMQVFFCACDGGFVFMLT